MQTIRLDEAQSRLPELVDSLDAGSGAILITRDDRPVAVLTAAPHLPRSRPSLRSITPSSVGAVLRQPSQDDDLLDEMRNG